MKDFNEKFIKKFDKDKLKFNEPLSKYTTVEIGGPGEIVYKPESTEDLVDAARFAQAEGIPLTVIGGGSNILIADRGLKGLVIINRCGDYEIGKRASGKKIKDIPKPRWELDGKTVRYHFEDLDYDESDKERIKVRVDSGLTLQSLMYQLIRKGITGLQWYAGIPGTLGGAIYNNIHGGSHYIFEVVESVRVLTPEGDIKEINLEEQDYEYNETPFHHEDYVIIDAVLDLYLGDAEKAKYTADQWRTRKQKVQPQRSFGCIFGNISNEEKEKHNFPTTSVGYIVEHVMEMTNYRIGNAFIPKAHHNFIETDGPAKAEDYLQIIKDVRHAVYDKLGIELDIEIILKGFSQEELRELEVK
jgi:UDP-N-acetylmuramate dehydrogenase